MSTLTSVDMNIDRSSTRLHAPPGGQSSICFGTYGQDENVAKPVNRAQSNNIFGAEQTNDVVKPSRRPSANNIYGSDETEEELERKRQLARRPSNSQGMGNVMAPVDEAPVTARRCRQAPGGTSSFTLG
jgi:hypothetical protein